ERLNYGSQETAADASADWLRPPSVNRHPPAHILPVHDRRAVLGFCEINSASGADQSREAFVRSLKFALPLLAATLLAGAAHAADPVKIRVSYVVAPSDWAPLLPEKPELLKHNGKSYTLEVVRVNGTPALVQAMAANEIEVGNHSYSSLGIAIQNAGM